MRIGFTGTRHGMTEAQRRTVIECLGLAAAKGKFEFHQGCCIGADTEAVELAWKFTDTIVDHPGPDDDPRQVRPLYTRRRASKGHLARNRDIVDECNVLIAAPAEREEQERGGTWYTIRYARKMGRPLVIVFPDGSRQDENR